jgi:hypothetical protein
MKTEIVEYFKMMIEEFSVGNDNEYNEGTLMSFRFEEDEKTDLDNYDEEDVNNFIKVREFIWREGDEVKYMGEFNGEPLEYTFKLIGGDIECSWIEPRW